MVLSMDTNLMNRILKTREVKFSDLPDGFDVESLPKDVEIIFDEEFPEFDDSFWDDEE